LDGVGIDFLENRSHNENGQEQGEGGDDLAGRTLLRAQRLTHEAEDDQESREGGHHDDGRGRQGQGGKDQQELNGTGHLGGRIAGLELDADPGGRGIGARRRLGANHADTTQGRKNNQTQGDFRFFRHAHQDSNRDATQGRRAKSLQLAIDIGGTCRFAEVWSPVSRDLSPGRGFARA
jgi:hypothetical protein